MKSKIKALALAATIALFSANSASANAVPYCREYTETFQIGGRTEQGYGTACLQPDGSWEKQGSNYNNAFELQKQNVVYIIDDRPVHIYRPGYRTYSSYSYAQPTTFFSLSFNDGYRSRPYYYNRGHYHNHRGHGYGHGHGGWKDKGDRGHGRGHGKNWHN